MLGRGLRPPEDGVVRHRRPECSWPLVLHVVCHLSGRVGLNSILGLYGRRSGEKKNDPRLRLGTPVDGDISVVYLVSDPLAQHRTL